MAEEEDHFSVAEDEGSEEEWEARQWHSHRHLHHLLLDRLLHLDLPHHHHVLRLGLEEQREDEVVLKIKCLFNSHYRM